MQSKTEYALAYYYFGDRFTMLEVGPYQLYSLLTSNFGLDGGAMFGIIPKALWQKKIEVDDTNRIKMVTRSLLIKGDNKNILVDTGNGDKWSSKEKSIYKIDSLSMEDNLKQYGLSCEDITDVILTHLHFDHSGGATKYNHNQDVIPTFPNAKYYIQKKHFDHAHTQGVKDGASYHVQNWQILQENNQLVLLDKEQELFPNISLHIVDGHTPGQQLPLISADEQHVFYCADLFPTHHHIPYPWVMAYDLHPVQSIAEKKAILPKAYSQNWTLFFGHDPDMVACKVEQNKKGFCAGSEVSI
jgi:glyoxylase-like metal-dependent hydrolase (beta-lactamase superfamily II)